MGRGQLVINIAKCAGGFKQTPVILGGNVTAMETLMALAGILERMPSAVRSSIAIHPYAAVSSFDSANQLVRVFAQNRCSTSLFRPCGDELVPILASMTVAFERTHRPYRFSLFYLNRLESSSAIEKELKCPTALHSGSS